MVECEIEGVGVLRNPVVEVMKVHLPESVDEAVGLLGEGVLLAGGTHVMPHARRRPSRWSACAAPGSTGIERDGDTLTIGAATTLAAGRRARSPFLHDAIESIASPTIRNLATVGGNLFVPAAARRPRRLPARARRARDDRRRRRRARGRRARAEGLVTRQLHGPRALVLHEGDAPQAELARRSSRSPPTARGSRSAASRRGRCARLAAEAALAAGRHRQGGRAVRRGRRPVRRRLRQRLVPPPRPARPRPPSSRPMPSSVIELEVNGEPSRSSSPSPAPRC